VINAKVTRLALAALLFLLNVHPVFAQKYEADPAKNGANEIMKKVLAALPENERKRVAFAFISPNSQADQVSRQIAGALNSGKPTGILAIGGPDAALNKTIVLSALGRVSSRVSDLKLVYVGAPKDRAEVEKEARRISAAFLFVPL